MTPLIQNNCGGAPYDPWAGWTIAQKQAALSSAMQAMFDLSTGGKVESLAYTQGDGQKAVTYTRADLGNLNSLIASLKQSLGLPGGKRRARGITFL